MADSGTAYYVGPDAEPDKYRLRRQVGGGGEAELWEADLTVAGGRERVAVKILRDQHGADFERWRDRWAEQVEMLRLISHPGVVGVHCQFEGSRMHPPGDGSSGAGRALYLVMNWIDGEDLRDWVPRHRDPEHLASALRCLAQVGDVLDWLHSGRATPSGRPVVHGDISPANVLVNADGQAVLVDFGLFRLARHSTAAPAGTRGYWAPEVLARGTYSPASDRYAFGGLAYYVLTGSHPPEDITQRRAALASVSGLDSLQLDQLLLIFDEDVRMRPPAGEWVRMLRLHTSTANPNSSPLPPQPPGQAPIPPRTARRRPPSARGPRFRRPSLLAGAIVTVVATTASLIGLSLSGPSTGSVLGNETPAKTTIETPTSTESIPATETPSPAGVPTVTSSGTPLPSATSPEATTSPAEEAVPLAALPSVESDVSYDAFDSGPATVNRHLYNDAIYVSSYECAATSAYSLEGRYMRLEAKVGLVDYRNGAYGKATFGVDLIKEGETGWVIGKRVSVSLYQTEPLVVDLVGALRVRLTVWSPGDCSPAALVEPVVVRAGRAS